MKNKARGQIRLYKAPRHTAIGATNMTGFELLLAAALGAVGLLRGLLLSVAALSHTAARLRGRAQLRAYLNQRGK